MKKYVYYVVYSYNANNNTTSGYGYVVQNSNAKIKNKEQVEYMHKRVKDFIEEDVGVTGAIPIVTNFFIIDEYMEESE